MMGMREPKDCTMAALLLAMLQSLTCGCCSVSSVSLRQAVASSAPALQRGLREMVVYSPWCRRLKARKLEDFEL